MTPKTKIQEAAAAIKSEMEGTNTHGMDNGNLPEAKTENDSIIEELEPWETSVNVTELIQGIESLLERHIIMPNESRLALAVWIVASYCFDAFRIFPRVVIHSPEKRCGKTTTMEIIQSLVSRGILASNISPAATFRLIEKYHPTLIIDEADSFLKDNEQLRGIINSSHTKSGSFVIRCEGDNNEPKKYSTWSPIVMGGIKRVADTIEDRSVIVELQRKMPGERVQRLPVDLHERQLVMRRKLSRWRDDNSNLLRNSDPSLPEVGNDRANDNWLPLFAIAEKADPIILERLTTSFIRMESKEKSETIGTLLLEDIRNIFYDRNARKVWTQDLIHDLMELEERPWESWKGGFTSRALGNMLRDFSVKSRDIRLSGAVKKGYLLQDFNDSFARYLKG